MRGLNDRVAIISGAESGIGRASARRMAAEGAIVILAVADAIAGEAAASDIRALGDRAEAVAFDLLDEASIAALMQHVRNRHGGFSILCNAAALTSGPLVERDNRLGDLDLADWRRVLEANTTGTMLMIRHALPSLIEAGGSAIVNIGSGLSLTGDVARTAHAASKAAIDSLSRDVAAQYGRQGVRCNVVAPLMIATDTARQLHGEAALGALERHVLIPYLGEPEDVAALVALLASDEGGFITGQVMQVDGGYGSHFGHMADIASSFWQTVAARA